MEIKDNFKMPVLLQMALSTDISAFKAFLEMEDIEQDKILKASMKIKNAREMQGFVSNIPNVMSK
ncbi:MAG: hypothetical protein IKC74_03530 [Clostridia bacterium]|nr:hypothetical protein [Clostridia bacterium]